MRLIQIPFSHNCIKVRRALELKQLPYDTTDIAPMDRREVETASGQRLVPVLVDDGTSIAGSTRILLHLERAYPDRPLMPADPARQAECWVLVDWADQAFMAMTRRLAALAVERLGGRAWLVDERTSVADVTLAAMAAPLWVVDAPLRDDPAVRDLLEWAAPVLGPRIVELYTGAPAQRLRSAGNRSTAP